MRKISTLLDGLTFPEGPRWYDSRFWFSDFYSRSVIRIDMDGNHETVATVPQQPSGLGWTPDGVLLIVSMKDQKVMRMEGQGLFEHADLSSHSRHWCNDMVVDAKGGAYVGNFGFDRHSGQEPRKTTLVRIEPSGEASIAADDLWFPNGTVISPDGKTLIVAETLGSRLTSFDIDAQGSLSNRRTFVERSGMFPDGICLDAECAVWVADPRNKEVIRIRNDGEVTERIDLGVRGAYACMLGGPDKRTLFICSNVDSGPKTAEIKEGRIDFTRVDVPGAGWP